MLNTKIARLPGPVKARRKPARFARTGGFPTDGSEGGQAAIRIRRKSRARRPAGGSKAARAGAPGMPCLSSSTPFPGRTASLSKKAGAAGLFRQDTFPLRLEARPGKRAGKPCCARLPNPPRMSPGSDCLWRAAALQASPMVFRRMAWEGTAPLPASPQKYFLFVDTQGRRECHPAGLCAPQGCQDRKIGLVQALRPCASTTSARR